MRRTWQAWIVDNRWRMIKMAHAPRMTYDYPYMERGPPHQLADDGDEHGTNPGNREDAQGDR